MYSVHVFYKKIDMRVVSINKYQVIYYDKANQLLKSEWLEESAKMPISKFRKEAERILNFALKYKPRFAMVDLSNFKYDFNQRDMMWFNSIHNSDLAEKVGIIISNQENPLFQGVNELINNNNILNKKTKMFTTEFETLDWLDLKLV
jgi:hypothetical protein